MYPKMTGQTHSTDNRATMRFLLQSPEPDNRLPRESSPDTAPLWVVLHGAFATAEQSIHLFGQEATDRGAFLLAPEATRPCGEGYCWSFAQDTAAISQEIASIQTRHPVDPTRITLIGYSMGCTMGCWLVAQNPYRFAFFASLCMGSAFEHWEYDDGGIDEAGLRAAAATTRLLLAVDRADPAGTDTYFDQNLSQFQKAGLLVDMYRPDTGTHEVTPSMKERVLQLLP